jgi:hypothetical protein
MQGGTYTSRLQEEVYGREYQFSGKIFDVTSRDAVHQFSETIKAVWQTMWDRSTRMEGY